MEYRYTAEKQNYEDFSSGRVLYNQKGATAFPVRLASEIYQRGREMLRAKGKKSGYTLYDPCCGGGYLLTTLGFLHGEDIVGLVASDIDENAVRLAEKNLSLLSPEGMENRIRQLEGYLEAYGKASHREVLDSAERLQTMNDKRNQIIRVECFRHDIFDTETVIPALKADMVIVDVPYGNLVQWSEPDKAMAQFLENIVKWVATDGIVIIVSDKKQTIRHPQLRRLEHFKVGKRQAALLEPVAE